MAFSAMRTNKRHREHEQRQRGAGGKRNRRALRDAEEKRGDSDRIGGDARIGERRGGRAQQRLKLRLQIVDGGHGVLPP